MKAEYINPFLNATRNVLETMANVQLTAGKPYLKKDRIAVGDISGIIGLTGFARGVVVVSFSKACALKVINSMMGEQYVDLVDEVKDAVGEITNMVSGDARRAISEMGMTFEAGIPTVITGERHEITRIAKEPCIAIPFKVGNEDLAVEVSLEET